MIEHADETVRLGRCLVIGAGLIGSHVARRLADAGAEVVVFSRGLNPWFVEERRRGIDVRVGEICADEGLLAELVAQSDAVIHLGSSSRPPIAAREPLFDVRETILPALTVMRLVAASPKSPTLVLASSGGTVYGDPRELPTPESHPLRPQTPYAISNVAVEHYAHFYGDHGVRAVVLRFSNVYGPGERDHGGQGVVGTWLRRIAAGEEPVLLARPELARDFLYVADAAEAVTAVLRRGRASVYNVGSSRSIALAEVMKTVRRATGAGAEFEPSPRLVEHPTGHIARTQLDTRRLRSDTGWTPQVAFDDGVRRTWEWIQSQVATPALRRAGESV